MKLYELMRILSKYPAGADVRIKGSMMIKELEKGEKIDDDAYVFNAEVEDVDIEDISCDEVMVSIWMGMPE